MTFQFKNSTVIGWGFWALAFLSLPFAHAALTCHSYARETVRFAADMTLRTLFIALPFILGLTGIGFLRKRSWAQLCGYWSVGVLLAVAICVIVLAFR